ncbi:hypothetical protein [Marivita sp.]|jgi:hypothetical protein|uniref:hypothetical protein n=1 Tax=Marivita sp. TaxID=2003365 RepID=UPI003219C15E
MSRDDEIKNTGFPLEQWFDLTKHIPRTDRDLCEAQMMLYALKEDMDPEGPEATREINEMKRAVKLHNRKFST